MSQFAMSAEWDRPARTGGEPTTHILRVRVMPAMAGAGSGLGGAAGMRAGVPVRLAMALDVSGSMAGEKLHQAKRACASVIRLLRPEDRLSLAGFSTELVPIVDDLPGGPDALPAARGTLERLRAVGVTRADVALQWLQQALPPAPGALRMAILITDGRPTDPTGQRAADPAPLLAMAERLGAAGVTLCALGLGSAASFNTPLLARLSEQGGGSFLHAETPDRLSEVLSGRLSAAQAVAAAQAVLAVEPLSGALRLRAACRFRPDYLPLPLALALPEAAGSDAADPAGARLPVGALRLDAATDLLLEVEIGPPGNGRSDTDAAAPPPTAAAAEPRPVLRVRLLSGMAGRGEGEPLAGEVVAAVSDTRSYAQAQRRDASVERDALNWDVNRYADALMIAQGEATGVLGEASGGGGAAAARRTGHLLAGMEQSARRAGGDAAALADAAAAQIRDLRATGRLDPERATGLLTASRGLPATGTLAPAAENGVQPNRTTGVLPSV